VTRALVRIGLGWVLLIPLMVCMAAFTDLDFWPSAAIYACVGLYGGCTSVIDRKLS
jgi:hypothetical protein